MRYLFLILFFGLSGCAVVSDKWYCENTFSAYEESYPKICLKDPDNLNKCLRNEKDKDIQYKKKTGLDRHVELIKAFAPPKCKQYLILERKWSDTKLDEKGIPIKGKVFK